MNKDKILFFLFTSSILAAAGAFIDVQILKAEVRDQEIIIKETHDNVQWLRDRWIERFGRE